LLFYLTENQVPMFKRALEALPPASLWQGGAVLCRNFLEEQAKKRAANGFAAALCNVLP